LLPPFPGPLDPEELAVLYIMLVHNSPQFAIRIIDALDEPMHTFVLHVDAAASATQAYLQEYLAERPNVHILPETQRVQINWGGYSIVNATMQAMRYAWDQGIHFDYLIDISGTTYPLKSNAFIRKSLAQSPNTVHLETNGLPTKPDQAMWNQFVECDGNLHRIARMPYIRGINMYVSSQWFAVPRHYVHWLLHSTLVAEYERYAQYIIVADENFFATMFFNSPFCKAEVKRSLVYLLFDKWEHDRNVTETGRARDPKKCLGVGELNCGRSPTTLTMEYLNLIGSSRSLFARKFDPNSASSMQLVDFIDSMRGSGDATRNASKAEREKWDSNRDEAGAGVGVMIKLGADHHLRMAAAYATTRGDNASLSHGAGALPSSLLWLSSLPLSSVASVDNVPAGSDSSNELRNTYTPEYQTLAQAMCLSLSTKPPHFIRAEACNASSTNQWFEIGESILRYFFTTFQSAQLLLLSSAACKRIFVQWFWRIKLLMHCMIAV
jgi:hypothetical protein